MVVRLDDGTTALRCAVDARKAQHAFGAAGVALEAAARRLCESLAQHVAQDLSPQEWSPPFEGARVARASRFSARDAESAMLEALMRHSSMHTLLAAYEIPAAQPRTNLVDKVRREVSANERTQHLARRFNRDLVVGGDAPPLQVDFLGQHYACFFIRAATDERTFSVANDRAFGKMWQLQALKHFVARRPRTLGLLEDERPEAFELLVVGERSHPVQRRAMDFIESMADRGEVVARQLPNARRAAEHLVRMEHLAA